MNEQRESKQIQEDSKQYHQYNKQISNSSKQFPESTDPNEEVDAKYCPDQAGLVDLDGGNS